MSAILKVNTTWPKGFRGLARNDGLSTVVNPTPLDSGNIVANGKSGVGPRRLTMGIEGRASTLVCDATPGQAGNFLAAAASGNPQVTSNITPTATITNITITNSTINGVLTSTLTLAAVNSFVIDNTIILSGLTTVSALNGLAARVTTGTTGTSITATVVQFSVPTQTSATETGSATLDYFGRAAGFNSSQTQ